MNTSFNAKTYDKIKLNIENNTLNKIKNLNKKINNKKSNNTFKDTFYNQISKSKTNKEIKEVDKKEDKKLKEVCIQMESIFVNQMLKAMRQTLNKENDILYGGMAQEIFEDMLYNEYALKLSKTANLGLAKMLYNQLKQNI